MRLLINHLTRMQAGFVCVAGLDGNGNHVRPVIAGRLPRSTVSVEGGPFDLGTIVELGATAAVGSPPDVEDQSFVLAAARAVRVVDGEEFWQELESRAQLHLTEIFGDDLVRRSAGATVNPQQGRGSLGLFQPVGRVTISRSGDGARLRIGVTDSELGVLDLSLTDLRFVDSTHKNIDDDAFDEASKRLRRGEPVVLAVGLARAFRARNDDAERHWLQVNNLHFENHPDWRLDNP